MLNKILIPLYVGSEEHPVLAAQVDSADGGIVDEVPVHEADPRLGEDRIDKRQVLFRDHVL